MNLCDVYQNYYQYIFNYAFRLTYRPEDAFDVMQNTLLKAMQKLDTLESEQVLASWLRTICFHEFVNRAERDSKKYLMEPVEWEKLEREGVPLINATPQPEDEVIAEEEIRSLQDGRSLAMIRKLTLHQRIAFSLVDIYGLPIEHVAGILDIFKGAVKGLLYRARMNIDSFSVDHCSIIYEKNSCSCKVWIALSLNRSNLQSKVKKLIDRLDFEQKDYTYDESVRKRVMYLYRHMLKQKPSDEWYQSALTMLM